MIMLRYLALPILVTRRDRGEQIRASYTSVLSEDESLVATFEVFAVGAAAVFRAHDADVVALAIFLKTARAFASASLIVICGKINYLAVLASGYFTTFEDR